LCGVLYVLDEPTIGLHPRDNRRLLGALQKLRDLGNTLLVVEHDREVVAGADQLLDFGPAAGDGGGQIVARGTPAQVAKAKTSVTGPFLSGKKGIPVPTNRRISETADADTNANRGLVASLKPSRRPRALSCERNRALSRRAAGSKSSAPGITTCATSMSASRWAV
jgi:excinuclease ABC subunit A